MAHFAIQVASVTVDIEDEDATADGLSKLGMAVLGELVELLEEDDEEDDDDGE